MPRKKPEFQWVKEARSRYIRRVSPQVVGERLAYLKRKHGKVTPRVLCDDASRPRSPIRPCFEWDEAEAADQRRMEQARYLLRSITVVSARIVKGAPKEPTRAWVAVRSEENPEEQEYCYIGSVLATPERRKELVAKAKRDLESWLRKYKQLKELAALCSAIRKELKK